MTEETPIAELPMDRPAGRPFDPPEELTRLRAERPLARMTYPDGHLGWLVTNYALNRAVLADLRFSSRQELMHSPLPGAGAMVGTMPPAPPGMFIGVDPPDHTRYRRLLTGKFTVRRMRLLTERVEQVAADHLDAMANHGPTVDLVSAYAQPIPAMMICELLGVPYEDREFFQKHATTMNSSHDTTPQDQYEALTALQGYLTDLVLAKRKDPTDDLLSDLTTEDLTDEELGNIGTLLLGAGFDTTANMIALGMFALFVHPDQLTRLRTDPGVIDQAVEELLRYLSIAHTGARTALADVELDGKLIREGECVTVSVQTANRDPERFPDPDVLDLTRQANGHVSLGHGIHQCLGQQLARVQMRVAFPALLDRFPTLELAVPQEEVPLRTYADIYGLHALPVTWQA
ncbi:cytochrome P450 [Actinocrispum wychmicini]|uniref:Cytochrome P450 n=1 Tax=Actinocrispum wychmicini TaxID=1213861 RepID=A0A4R2J7A8_9PSEU|nr:cytochrome P450 [Actinocrispum wychmicini]TCO54973.1 cytochrome P450 [Actinocrispum wychmicini]